MATVKELRTWQEQQPDDVKDQARHDWLPPDWGRVTNSHPRHFTSIFGRVRRLERKYDKLREELERAVYYLDNHRFDDITGKAVLGTTESCGRNVE